MKGVCVGEMVHAFLDASSRRHKTAHVCVCDRVRVQEVGVLVCVCGLCAWGWCQAARNNPQQQRREQKLGAAKHRSIHVVRR